MAVPFTRVTFVDDSDLIPVDADNLNAIETALETVCEGGAASGVDSDTVRGKVITDVTPLTKGLLSHWDMSARDYPDNATTTLYLNRDWMTVDGWEFHSSCTVSVVSNQLAISQTGTAPEITFKKTSGLASMANKTIKLKIKNTGNFTGIQILDSSYVDMILVPHHDYFIATYTASATLGTELRIKLLMANGTSNTVQSIAWIYAGDADYLSLTQDHSKSYGGSIYGATPAKNRAAHNSLYFDGVNDRVLLPISSVARNNAFSIVIKGASCWNNTSERTLCALGNALRVFLPSGGSSLSIQWATADALTNVFSLPNESGSSTISTVIITYDNQTFYVYKDGVYVTHSTTPALDLSFANIELGSKNSAAYFVGLIGPVSFYNRALTSAEAWEIHQRPYFLDIAPTADSSLKYRVPSTATSPGKPGDIVYGSDFLYVCVAPNTWKRATLATW